MKSILTCGLAATPVDLRHLRCPVTFAKARVVIDELAEGEAVTFLYDKQEGDRLPTAIAALEVTILNLAPANDSQSLALTVQRT